MTTATNTKQQLEAFFTWLVNERGRSESTLYNYRVDLAQFQRFLAPGPADWADVTPAAVRNFLDSLDRRYARATVSRRFSAMATFFGWLTAEAIIPTDPLAGLPWPGVSRSTPAALSRLRLDMLMEQASASGLPTALRDRAMLEVFAFAGLRTSELAKLTIDDLVQTDGDVYLVAGRGTRRERYILLNARLCACLHDYVKHCRKRLVKRARDRSLFVNRYGRTLGRAGVCLIVGRYGNLTPTMLRDDFVLRELAAGRAPDALRETIGQIGRSSLYRYRRPLVA